MLFFFIICYNQNSIRQSFIYHSCKENTQTPTHLQIKLAQLNKTVFSDEKAAEIVMANVLPNYCKAMGREW